jgi:hypothetical protein
MKLLVISDGYCRDPLPHLLGKLSPDAEKMPLDDFLDRAGYLYDRSEGGLRDIGQAPESPAMSRYTIVDRVTEILPETVHKMTGGLGSLSRGQISLAYQQALEKFGYDVGDRKLYSTVGKFFPLFTQWRMAKDELGLESPDFIYGYGPEPVDAAHFSKPVFKSPTNLYEWKPNQPPVTDIWDTFVVDVPRGDPVVSFMVGDRSDYFMAKSPDTELDKETAAFILDMTAKLLPLFSAKTGEVLWFVDDRKVTFAAFSHTLFGSARHPKLEALLSAYLVELGARLHA